MHSMKSKSLKDKINYVKKKKINYVARTKYIPSYYFQFIYYFALKINDHIWHIIESANVSL